MIRLIIERTEAGQLTITTQSDQAQQQVPIRTVLQLLDAAENAVLSIPLNAKPIEDHDVQQQKSSNRRRQRAAPTQNSKEIQSE